MSPGRTCKSTSKAGALLVTQGTRPTPPRRFARHVPILKHRSSSSSLPQPYQHLFLVSYQSSSDLRAFDTKLAPFTNNFKMLSFPRGVSFAGGADTLDDMVTKLEEYLEKKTRKQVKRDGEKPSKVTHRSHKDTVLSYPYSRRGQKMAILAKSMTQKWTNKCSSIRYRRPYCIVQGPVCVEPISAQKPEGLTFFNHKTYQEGTEFWTRTFNRELLLAVVGNTRSDGKIDWTNVAHWMQCPDVKDLQRRWQNDHGGRAPRHFGKSTNLCTGGNVQWTHSEVSIWIDARQKGQKVPQIASQLSRHSEQAVRVFHDLHAHSCRLSNRYVWRRIKRHSSSGTQGYARVAGFRSRDSNFAPMLVSIGMVYYYGIMFIFCDCFAKLLLACL